ncbi:hypothetical protein Godav_019187 [Gossypium davidsonii]|uniref:Uncharacterized protein n=1 Tax=Gossypium davidsonii TaxID=34287 RepID=A0A7J8QYX6_GOSDV|nr:hypothetical protein [Gossypium davidsonii]
MAEMLSSMNYGSEDKKSLASSIKTVDLVDDITLRFPARKRQMNNEDFLR